MSGSEKPKFSGALTVCRELDLILPDSGAVRDAFAQAEAESQPWLFNHVMRSWLYGAKLAQRRGLRMPSWSLSRCFYTISALRVVALPIVASRSWARTSAAPLPFRMIWGSAERKQFGTRSRSTPSLRLRSIRARTWRVVRTASHVTTADSVTMS